MLGLLNRICRSLPRRTADVPHNSTIERLEDRRLLSDIPEIGVNLDWSQYFTPAWTFTDVFQSSSLWYSHAYDTVTGVRNWSGGGEVHTDSHGWPTSLNEWTNSDGHLMRQQLGTLMFRDIDDKYPAGIYRAEWEGTGTVKFGFAATTIEEGITPDGRNYALLSVVPQNNGIWLRIETLDPADPIRDIHLWMPDYNGQSFAGKVWTPGADFSPFHPLFLERLQPFKAIRFMDWTSTNFNNLRVWSDRRTPQDARQAFDDGKGVAYEYLIELANELDADVWINMPHMADDDYVRNYATLVRDHLEPGRKIYIEWSNEVWNTIFPVQSWVTDQLALPENAGMSRFAFVAREIKRDFDIWSDVFSGQEHRMVRVLAGQAADKGIVANTAKYLDGTFDAISAAGYIYPDPKVAATFDASTTPEQVIREIMAYIPVRLAWWSNHKALADQYSAQLGRHIAFVAYEGGQHLKAAASAPYANAYAAAQSHPLMYQAYQQILAGFKDLGGELFMHYANVSLQKPTSSWGALAYQDQPISEAPKYQALLDAISGAIYYDPPVANASGPYTVLEGASLELAAFSSTGHNLLYAWDLDGDGIFGETGTAAQNGDETGATPLFRTNGLNGPDHRTVYLRVTDAFGRIATTSSPITINDVPPTLSITGANTRVAGLPYTLNLSASDPGPDPVLSWIIDWGDGSAPQTISGNPSLATYTYTAPGSFTPAAQAVNRDGTFRTTKSTPVVVSANPGGPYAVAEGGSVTLSPIVAQTAGYSYAWDLDGDGVFGETGASALHGNEIGHNPLFLANGLDGPSTHPILLRITDTLGQSYDAIASVNIADTAPTLSITGANIRVAGLPYTLNLSASDPGPDPVLSWIIDWGDGSAPQTISGNPSLATYTYTAPGSFTPAAQAVNRDGTFRTTKSTPVVVSANPGGPYAVAEGGSVTLSPIVAQTAGYSYAWDLDGDGVFGETGASALHGNEIGHNPLFLANGLDGPSTHPILLRITDTLGQSYDAIASVNIADAPTAAAISGQPYIPAGVDYALNLSATDPGPDPVLSWIIDWGDGSTPQTLSGNPKSVAYRYTTPGAFNVSARAVNKDGSFDAGRSVSIVVAANPGGPYYVLEGSSVQLHAIASLVSSPTYQWDLDGDGIFGETGPDALHGDETGHSPVFHARGMNGPHKHTINLRVIDSIGRVSAAYSTVTVIDAPPTLSITGTNSAMVAEPYTLFLSASDPGPDAVDSWLINWGDGSDPEIVAGSATSVTHTFFSPGSHNISASAVTAEGVFETALADPILVANDVPSAVLSEVEPITLGKLYTDIVIAYADATGFADNAFDSTDIVVTGPRRFREYASFFSKTTIGNSVLVTYRLAAPGGFWGPEDDGNYGIWVVAGAVSDALGTMVPEARLVSIPVDLQTAGSTIKTAATLSGTPGDVLAAQQTLAATQTDAYYKVRVTSDMVIELELSGLASDSTISLVDRYGRPVGPTSSAMRKPKASQLFKSLRQSSLTKPTVTRTSKHPVAPGLYYIRIHTPGGAKVQYGLKVKLARAK